MDELHVFSRAELLLGKEKLEKLKKARVAVFGIGGVGSFAAEAIARGGVGHIALIDGDAFRHDRSFILPNGRMKGNQLTIDIGQADGVMVHKIHGTDAAAGQGFCHITAHTAQTEHCNPGILQFFHCIRAQYKLGSGKGIHSDPPSCFLLW